jgi:hypothetical protein
MSVESGVEKVRRPEHAIQKNSGGLGDGNHQGEEKDAIWAMPLLHFSLKSVPAAEAATQPLDKRTETG